MAENRRNKVTSWISLRLSEKITTDCNQPHARDKQANIDFKVVAVFQRSTSVRLLRHRSSSIDTSMQT